MIRLDVCRKLQGKAEDGNTCLQTPGTCESCPEWESVLWRPLPRFPAYLVSIDGRVRHCGKYEHYTNANRKPIDLVARPDQDGYLAVRVWHEGKRILLRVHRAVADAFLGPKPPDKEINHKDSNKLHNHAENLEYVSQRENLRHKFFNGRCARGERMGAAKTNEQEVKEIRELAAQGIAHNLIAKKFQLSTSTTHSIIHRITWRHV